MRWVTVLPLGRDKWPSALYPALRGPWVLGAFLKNFTVPLWCLRPVGWQCCREPGPGLWGASVSLWPSTLAVASRSSGPRVCGSCGSALAPRGCPGSSFLLLECSISFIGSCEIGCQNGAELGLVWVTEGGWVLGAGLLVVHCWPSGLELCDLAPTMVLPLAHAPEGGRGGGRHPLVHVTPLLDPRGGTPYLPHALCHVSGSPQGDSLFLQGFLSLLFPIPGALPTYVSCLGWVWQCHAFPDPSWAMLDRG